MFNERPLRLVLPEDERLLHVAHVWDNPHYWIGKRVTMYGTTCKFGRDDVGLPPYLGKPGHSRGHAHFGPTGPQEAAGDGDAQMVLKAAANAPAQPTGVDPRILTAFGILGWGLTRQAQYVADNEALGQAGMVKDLNRLIEEQDAA